MKFFIMRFSPRSVFLPFRSKYPPHSVLRNPQSMFLPQSERSSFAPIQHKWQNYRRITPCRLSGTAYSTYSQLPSIHGGRLLRPQRERAISYGDKTTTEHGLINTVTRKWKPVTQNEAITEWRKPKMYSSSRCHT